MNTWNCYIDYNDKPKVEVGDFIQYGEMDPELILSISDNLMITNGIWPNHYTITDSSYGIYQVVLATINGDLRRIRK